MAQAACDESEQKVAIRKALDTHAVRAFQRAYHDHDLQEAMSKGDPTALEILRNALKKEPETRLMDSQSAWDRQVTECAARSQRIADPTHRIGPERETEEGVQGQQHV